MASASIETTLRVIGLTPEPRTVVFTEDGQLSVTPTLAAGIEGTMNSGGDGVDVMPTGHGITTAQSVTLSWVAGDSPLATANGVRYGCTVDSASTNEIIISGGYGDALPPENTVILVGVEQTLLFPLDGDNVSLLVVDCAERSSIVFHRTEAPIAGVSDTDGVVDGIVTGHGITDTDLVTIVWTGGARYGCTVATSSANEIELTGGTGDALPADTTPVTIYVEVIAKVLEIKDGAPPFTWHDKNGYTNPLTGEPCTRIVVANCSATAVEMGVYAIFTPSI